jgi:hypothetical protein
LAISVNPPRKDTNIQPETADYTSSILKLFIENLEDQPQKQVLDVGPACHENIIFFTRHVKRLYICDMFLHLMRCLSKKRPVSQIWKHLDYPPETFDGILLWELADRLDEQEYLCFRKRFSGSPTPTAPSASPPLRSPEQGRFGHDGSFHAG